MLPHIFPIAKQIFLGKSGIGIYLETLSSVTYLTPHSLLPSLKRKTVIQTFPMPIPLIQGSVHHVFSKRQNLVATFLSRSCPTSVALKSLSHPFQWRVYTTQPIAVPPQHFYLSLLLENRKPVPLTFVPIPIRLAVMNLSGMSLVLHPTRTLKDPSLSVSVPPLLGSLRTAADDTGRMVSKFVPSVVILGTLLQR